MVKIIDLNLIKEKINKLDAMANVDMSKPNTVFSQKSVSEKMQQFFEFADGNPEWNV